MARASRGTLPSLATLAAVIVAVVIASVARELVIPLALAGFLGFLLHPLVDRLERAGLRRVLAVLVVTVTALTPLAIVGWVAGSELLHLVSTLPQYEGNINQKIESLQGPAARFFARAAEMFRTLKGSA